MPSSRVIGLDSHPDSFTAAVLEGQTPAQAQTRKVFHKVPLGQLSRWAQKHLGPQDVVVLEASGNSFEVVRVLAAIDRQALVLESGQLGKLKEAHANNDKISAVRIGKAYLAGTAKEVWVPDPRTQERRDWFHAYSKATKRTTQVTNRLLSYLSDNGVRLNGVLPALAHRSAVLRQRKAWTLRQWQVLEGLLLELRHAEEQRAHWRRLIAQEVLEDPLLLSMVRLCGVRDLIAFALGAFIGDIHRFASPKKLVAYMGLNPAFDHSGQENWDGGIGGHGRRDLRSLLIQAAQAILRSSHPLAKWGRRLTARKGSMKLAVAAIARRLTVAIWYLMMGRWTALEEVDRRLSLKLGKILSQVGSQGFKERKTSRQQMRQAALDSLRHGRIYVLNAQKMFTAQPSPRAATTAPRNPPSPSPKRIKCRNS